MIVLCLVCVCVFVRVCVSVLYAVHDVCGLHSVRVCMAGVLSFAGVIHSTTAWSRAMAWWLVALSVIPLVHGFPNVGPATVTSHPGHVRLPSFTTGGLLSSNADARVVRTSTSLGQHPSQQPGPEEPGRNPPAPKALHHNASLPLSASAAAPGSMRQQILALAMPALLTLAIDPLMSLADTVLVGVWAGINPIPLASMGSATAILTFSLYIFNFLSTATAPLISEVLIAVRARVCVRCFRAPYLHAGRQARAGLHTGWGRGQ